MIYGAIIGAMVGRIAGQCLERDPYVSDGNAGVVPTLIFHLVVMTTAG